MVFGIIPECHSASLRNRRSASPESPTRDVQLENELLAPMFGYNVKGLLQIESKAKMKARKVASPNYADALSLTFERPIQPARRPVSAMARQIAIIRNIRGGGSEHAWMG
jgi:hypothetical protein